MGTIRIRGMEEYELLINRLNANMTEIIEAGVYEGAKVLADAVRVEIEALPIDNGWGTPDHMINGVKRVQKDGLLESFGVSPMRDERGFINVHIGFDGYNDLVTKRWPNGQPNAMIARATESGTSFSKKIPFIKRAVRNAKARSEAAAKIKIEEKIYALQRSV